MDDTRILSLTCWSITLARALPIGSGAISSKESAPSTALTMIRAESARRELIVRLSSREGTDAARNRTEHHAQLARSVS